MKHLRIIFVHNMLGNYWRVTNKHKEILGTFSWVSYWKELSWKQNEHYMMSTSCLKELAEAMDRRQKVILKRGYFD